MFDEVERIPIVVESAGEQGLPPSLSRWIDRRA